MTMTSMKTKIYNCVSSSRIKTIDRRNYEA